MPEPTIPEMLTCARRELKMRRNVYPRWVADRRMTDESARREIACIEGIVTLLESKTERALDLFTPN